MPVDQSLKVITPSGNVVPDESLRFQWRAVTPDPQFSVEGVAALAGDWVKLTVEITSNHPLSSALTVYLDLGTGYSEDCAFALTPDASGHVRFTWKMPKQLQAVRIDPMAQECLFSIETFELGKISPEQAQEEIARQLPPAATGASEAISEIASRRQHHPQRLEHLERYVELEFRHSKRELPAQGDASDEAQRIARGRRERPDRLQILEGYVEQAFQRTRSDLTWTSCYVPKVSDDLDHLNLPVKAIAFYSSMFYPNPESDVWWGKGFTEWSLVTRAKPQFIGQHQPRLPVELGLYDQRLPTVLRQQIALARKYGIHGFCFHHHWFGGKRVFDLPISQLLDDATLEINFCICWSNHDLTLGPGPGDLETLIAEKHSAEDDVAWFDSLVPAFSDARYVRINGAPVLLVRNATLLPDPGATSARWRQRAIVQGFPGVYLIAAGIPGGVTAFDLGFDASAEFPPFDVAEQEMSQQYQISNPSYQGKVYDYSELAGRPFAPPAKGAIVFRTVMPSWDDEARNPGKGSTYADAEPAHYAQWLSRATQETLKNDPEHRLLFINSWNGWADGSHLEPDRHFGYAYLHSTANVMRNMVVGAAAARADVLNRSFVKRFDAVVILHLYYEDLIDEIISSYLHDLRDSVDLIVSIKPDTRATSIDRIRRGFQNSLFVVTQNRGRDIRPFLLSVREANRLGYQYVCKVHTKKSPHRIDGEAWREALVTSLLGSRTHVDSVLAAFEADRQLSLLAPPRSLCDLSDPVIHGGNMKWLDLLLERTGAHDQIAKYQFQFPAGSMYWLRLAAFLPLLDEAIVSVDEFELEAGQLDGTLAHAMERVIGLLATFNGFAMREIWPPDSQAATDERIARITDGRPAIGGRPAQAD